MFLTLLFSVFVHAAPATPELQVTIGSFTHETLFFTADGETRKIAIQSGEDTRTLHSKALKKADYDKWIKRFQATLKKGEGKPVPDCQVNVSVKLKDSAKHLCFDDKEDVDREFGELWIKMKDALK